MTGGRGLLILVSAFLLLVGNPAQAADAPSRLVSYGHSWPAGLGVARPYPVRVADRLDVALVNRAHAGDLSAATLDRIRVAHPRGYDIVTIETGLNDANLYGMDGLRRYRKNLRAMFAETERARLVVLILDPRIMHTIDYPPYDQGTPAVLREYRLAAREIASAAGARIVAPTLDDPVDWQADGMHPSGAGHRLIAAAVAGAIRRSGVL